MTPPLLSLHDVRLSFGPTEILRGSSFDVAPGEIHALIGPNGAGKSTLFNVISGRYAPTAGRIVFNGHDITAWAPIRIARLGLARSFQQTSAFPDLTVGENIAVAAMRAAGEPGSPFRRSGRMAAVWARVDDVGTRLGITGLLSARVDALAYAEQRRVEIALTIAGDPALVLLDEPTAGMSRAETQDAIDAIRLIAENRAVLLVEHDMNVVFGLANRISVLVQGEVLKSGTPQAVRNDDAVARAYLGKLGGGHG